MDYRRYTLVLGGALALVATSAALGQSVLFVDDDAPFGGDGATWETAFRFLTDALDAAAADRNVEVRVAQGTYFPDESEAFPNGTGETHDPWDLGSTVVALLGGYAGLAGIDPDARNPSLFETTLSGDLNEDDIRQPDFGNYDDNVIWVLKFQAAYTSEVSGSLWKAGMPGTLQECRRVAAPSRFGYTQTMQASSFAIARS